MGYSRRDVSAMQREVAPAIYGKLDLDKMPERFRTAIDSPLSGMARKVDVNEVAAFLDDEAEVYTVVMGKELSTKLGVTAKPTDPLATVALALPIAAVTVAANLLKKLPGGEERVDAWAIGRMRKMLERSGEAKYSTEPAHYAKTHAQPSMRAAHA